MVENNWSSFEEWKQIYEEIQCGLGSPFNDTPLTEDSIFLWNQMSAPMPSGATNGDWGIFPEPKALAGYLRYIALPIFFGIWLVREEWDNDSEKFLFAEELFDIAEQSGKCRYTEDIPTMRALIAELDGLMAVDNEAVKRGIIGVANQFNKRWEKTPTWSFKLEVYEDPVSVGNEIFNRVVEDMDEEYVAEEFGMTKETWMDICQNALVDTSAYNQFAEKLRDSAWF